LLSALNMARGAGLLGEAIGVRDKVVSARLYIRLARGLLSNEKLKLRLGELIVFYN
jgi:hypothetical protein